MEQLEDRILEILQAHQGQTRAIRVDDLHRMTAASLPAPSEARQTGTRKIRAIIARLVTERHAPIASTVHPPYGFYLITNAQEAKECLAQYWSRVEKVARRAKILAEVVKEPFGVAIQLELKFDAEDRGPSTA